MNSEDNEDIVDTWDRYLKELPFKRKGNCGVITPDQYRNDDERVGICNTYASRRAAKRHANNGNTKNLCFTSISSNKDQQKNCNASSSESMTSKQMSTNDKKEEIKRLNTILRYHKNETQRLQELLNNLQEEEE